MKVGLRIGVEYLSRLHRATRLLLMGPRSGTYVGVSCTVSFCGSDEFGGADITMTLVLLSSMSCSLSELAACLSMLKVEYRFSLSSFSLSSGWMCIIGWVCVSASVNLCLFGIFCMGSVSWSLYRYLLLTCVALSFNCFVGVLISFV